MHRRLPVLLALVAACAQGSLDNPGFGTPVSSTQAMTQGGSDGDDDDDDETGTSKGSGDGESSGDAESSSGSPVTAAQDESSSGDPTVDPSAESSSGDPTVDPSAGEESSEGPVEPPPPDVGEWQSCEEANCEAGNDCITVTGLDANDAYCAPQCVTDDDCPYPDSGDATPFCALIADDATEPTNCALVCQYDGLDYGTCPTGMVCSGIPGQDPTISLCMW